MTKQEKIIEAWGDSFPLGGVDENGFTIDSKWIEEFDHKLFDTMATGHGFQKIRPISLKGIENNNGWIKIETKKDFPTEFCYYNTCKLYPGHNEAIYFYGQNLPTLRRDYEDGLITHYKKIKTENPPLY